MSLQKITSKKQFIKLFTKACKWAEVDEIYMNFDLHDRFAGEAGRMEGYEHPIIRFNWDAIVDMDVPWVVKLILHEMGHLKYETVLTKDKVYSEYLAESFAIKTMQKCCPKLLPYAIKGQVEGMVTKEWKKKFYIHWLAFTKIKEYKKCIKSQSKK